jgi:hypothetical protein
LNLASNSIGGYYDIPGNEFSGFTATPEGTALIATLTFEFTACQYVGPVAIANAIKDMGALSNLDLSMNDIPAAEADLLNATCKAKGVDLAL